MNIYDNSMTSWGVIAIISNAGGVEYSMHQMFSSIRDTRCSKTCGKVAQTLLLLNNPCRKPLNYCIIYYELLGSSLMTTPSFGLREAVSINSHGIFVCSLGSILNFLNNVASVILHSVMAKRMPIQFLGPAPKGM